MKKRTKRKRNKKIGTFFNYSLNQRYPKVFRAQCLEIRVKGCSLLSVQILAARIENFAAFCNSPVQYHQFIFEHIMVQINSKKKITIFWGKPHMREATIYSKEDCTYSLVRMHLFLPQEPWQSLSLFQIHLSHFSLSNQEHPNMSGRLFLSTR